MYINSLALNNYRNYNNLEIEFSKGINILYGDNAQGKTNILEALFMAATTKSHRGSKDKEIIKFDQEETHIRIGISKNEITHRIDMHIKSSKSKGVAIDGIPIHKTAEIFGLINIIFFSPEDLVIIKNSPQERRRFIDMELCQLSKVYYSNLYNYNNVLKQRNNLLKQIPFKEGLIDTLDVWDMQLVNYGSRVITERNNFINMINEIIKEIHYNLTEGKEKLSIIYDNNTNIEEFADDILIKRDIDLKYQSTQVGPHRDDIIFMINNIDVRKFGSQGQQRTVALSLKLAEIELVKRISNNNPILLLDDVMSELDSTRRNALLDRIKNIQTIITCTGYDDFIKERLPIDRIYKVTNGTVCVKSSFEE